MWVRVFDRKDLITVSFDERWMQWWHTPNLDLPSGRPGIGVGGTYGGNKIAAVKLGPADTTPPAAVGAQNIAVTATGSTIEMQWQQPSDGASGVGVVRYDLSRAGVGYGLQPTTFKDDLGIQPNTTYTYTITAVDQHWNYSAPTTFTVTTPPASTIDIRRTGVRPSGAYRVSG